MKATPNAAEEALRIETLKSLCVLDTPQDEELDRITRIACRLFDVPTALVSLVDRDRQWFKSRVGLEATETSRDISFCSHAIASREIMVVFDATRDIRFAENPLVLSEPGIRFYAGHPLRSIDGHPLGTLCLIDRVPRLFPAGDADLLGDLAAMAEQYFHRLEAQKRSERDRTSREETERLFQRVVEQSSVGIALVCPDGVWKRVNEQLATMLGYAVPELLARRFQDIIHPEDLPENLEQFRRLLANEIPAYSLEKRFLRSNGSELWTEISVSGLHESDGRISQLIMVAIDIDARKRAELELKALRLDLEERVTRRTVELNDAVQNLEREALERRHAQDEVVQERGHFYATLENATDAFVEIDEEGEVVTWNKAAERIFGWQRHEAVGLPLDTIIVPADLHSTDRSGFARFMQSGDMKLPRQRMEMRAIRKSGEEFYVELTLGSTSVGGKKLINVFLHDISQRKRDEQKIRESNLRLQRITDNLPVLIGYMDRQQIYRFHNRQHEVVLKRPSSFFSNKPIREIFGESLYEVILPHIAKALAGNRATFEHRAIGPAGSRWLSITLVPDSADDGKIVGAYVLCLDVTGRKELEQRLRHEATHDTLTGLANRRSFMNELERAFDRSNRTGLPMALMFIDLDGFKELNDTYGHEFGDAALKKFAGMLLSLFRKDDFVARLAGDEFTVIIENIFDPQRPVERLCKNILSTCGGLNEIGGIDIVLSASMGVAIFRNRNDETPADLLKRADDAMYAAKRDGKNTFSISDEPAETDTSA
ncbi:PAS domain S-box protein [Paraburkholderia sp. IW21]|uniref:PAS domain S-box protein n=1 Tax=Paraburkholderia sp. IW21 TaxID=3242488 RepID=UPI00351FA20D